jgi:hypothetical protein
LIDSSLNPFHLQARARIPCIITRKSTNLLKTFAFIKRDGFCIPFQNIRPDAFTDFANADTQQFTSDAFAAIIGVNIKPGKKILFNADETNDLIALTGDEFVAAPQVFCLFVLFNGDKATRVT